MKKSVIHSVVVIISMFNFSSFPPPAAAATTTTTTTITTTTDLANPKSNAKTAGFTKEEREGFGKLLSEGFIDTFRHLYPDKKEAYSYWSYRSNARSRNKGW